MQPKPRAQRITTTPRPDTFGRRWLTSLTALAILCGSTAAVTWLGSPKLQGAPHEEVTRNALESKSELMSIELMALKKPRAGNFRNLTADQILEQIGMTDAEMRSDKASTSLPPEAIFSRAQQELVIAAISASRTFDDRIGNILAALDRGVKVNVLLVDPIAITPADPSQHEYGKIKSEIAAVADRITQYRLWEHSRFELRVRNYLPRFTGILIDGDIGATDTPTDSNGILRLQILTQYETPQKGPVLQLIPDPARPHTAFALFAGDLREQWRRARRIEREEDLVTPAGTAQDSRRTEPAVRARQEPASASIEQALDQTK